MARYVVFEGLDGSGKSTAIKNVEEWLVASGRTVVTTKTPTTGIIGGAISYYADTVRARFPKDTDRALFLGSLFIADMLEHNLFVQKFLQDHQQDGDRAWLLQSRSWYSTYGYQGASTGIREILRREVAPVLVEPHLVVVLTADHDLCLRRVQARGKVADAFESLEMFRQVETYQAELVDVLEHISLKIHTAFKTPEDILLLIQEEFSKRGLVDG